MNERWTDDYFWFWPITIIRAQRSPSRSRSHSHSPWKVHFERANAFHSKANRIFVRLIFLIRNWKLAFCSSLHRDLPGALDIRVVVTRLEWIVNIPTVCRRNVLFLHYFFFRLMPGFALLFGGWFVEHVLFACIISIGFRRNGAIDTTDIRVHGIDTCRLRFAADEKSWKCLRKTWLQRSCTTRDPMLRTYEPTVVCPFSCCSDELGIRAPRPLSLYLDLVRGQRRWLRKNNIENWMAFFVSVRRLSATLQLTSMGVGGGGDGSRIYRCQFYSFFCGRVPSFVAALICM